MTAAQSGAGFEGRDASSNVSLLIRGAVIVGIIAGIVFFLFPALDLKTSAFFYRGGGVFSGKGGGIFSGPPTTVADVIRLAFYFSFVAVCVVTLYGLAVSAIGKREVLGLGSVKWLFLGACLLLAPGLVGNSILKDHWGRARPAHLIEFGGTQTYTPPLVPSNQCQKNCSFVAGEPSMMFAAFFAAAFLFPAYGRRLIIAGVAVGLICGLIRISQGAHFLSDVIFAGVTMALTVAAIFLIFRAYFRAGTPPGPGGSRQDQLARRSL